MKLLRLGVKITITHIIQDGAVYRMYNPNSGEHFYTKDKAERDSLVNSGWTYEADSGFDTPGNEAGVSPVYRVYNPNSGLHHYTIESGEAKELVRIGWNFEGACVIIGLTGEKPYKSRVPAVRF